MNLDALILKQILLEQPEEEETEEKKELSPFEEDPMGFILKKYHTLNELLTELMTDSFQEYLNAIFIVAPKPTTFKVLLHNGQYFFLTYLDKAYQATISGKNYYLMTVGEKQLCMQAIARLLRYGSPLKTKGPEGAEQGTEGEEGAEAEGGEETAAAGGETGGEEEALTENIMDKDIIRHILLEKEEGVSGQDAEVLCVELWNASLKNKLPKELSQYKKAFEALKKYSSKYKVEIAQFSGRREQTTDFWKKETGKEADEPKTDIISVDEKKLRLSAKKGAAQLMSAKKDEGKATVIAAAKLSDLEKSSLNKVLKMVDQLADNTRTEKLNTSELKKMDVKSIKSKININAKKIIEEATKTQTKLQEELRELFNSDPKFKQAFAYEAMTGRVKFGQGSKAEANFVIAFNNDFTDAKLEDISNMSSSMVKKIADKCRVDVNFKSTSYKIKGKKAGYSFYSAIRVGLEDLVKKEKAITEAINSQELNEGLLDRIQDYFTYIYNKFNSIVDFISKGIQKIKELIKEGIDIVLDFLGIEMQVDFDNSIDFYAA